MSEPLITGVTAAIVGVDDFAPHLDFWCGQLGFEVVSSGTIDAQSARTVYGVDGQIEVKVLAAAGAESGRIALMKVEHSSILDARFPHTSELGYHALDLYTKDILATHKQLTQAGWEWVGTPEAYTVPLGDRVVEVVEGFCFGPEGTDVVFVEAKNARPTLAWEKDPTRPYTELTSVVCAVEDVDKFKEFFGPNGLGLAIWYDVTFTSPGLLRMAELPEGLDVRFVFLAGPNTARIELIKVLGLEPPADLREEQRLGKSLGHVGWSFRTHDLSAAAAVVVAKGGSLTCAPTLVDDPFHGRANIVSALTPEGAAFELWQEA